MAGRHRYSAAARSDVFDILRETERIFGLRQRDVYAGLIDIAVGMVAENPTRGGSNSQTELGAGIRSFHVAIAARRRGAAAHMIYYRVDATSEEVFILRVLHEHMAPERHVSPDIE
jgi:toxin ParE1/3/4